MRETRSISHCIMLLLAALWPFFALADGHEADNGDLMAAIKGFDRAYATNDVETYFGYYAEGATAYFFGARQDIDAYHEEWTAMMAAGGGVEKNEMSELQIQLMPSGDVAVVTSFIDNRTRYPDGSITESKAYETDVWQKIDGAWKIVNLHYSEITPIGD